MNPDLSTSTNPKIPAIGYLVCVLTTIWLTIQFVPSDWYSAANRPSWAPPGWLLTVLWVGFCLLLAVTAWRKERSIDFPGGRVVYVLILSIVLYWVWWWMFFGLHRIGWSMAIQSLVVLAAAGVLFRLRHPGRLLPGLSLLWATYLWFLNYSIWALNGGGLGSCCGF